MLITDFDNAYQLGHAQMDQTHREFVDLVNRLEDCDQATFIVGFQTLLMHTAAHFAAEQLLMEQSGFPATAEHTGEHQRVLGQLQQMLRRIERGSTVMARAFVREQLPGWFKLHAITMDSALAAHLRLVRNRQFSGQHALQIGRPVSHD
jgi:hemerythrin-like metal-binding protein